MLTVWIPSASCTSTQDNKVIRQMNYVYQVYQLVRKILFENVNPQILNKHDKALNQ